MKKNTPTIFTENMLPKRVDKALEWLTYSRNGWKEKCTETKLNLKRQAQENKRVKASRDEWKLSNISLKLELAESKKMNATLLNRVSELESKIQAKSNELYELKKKQ